MFLIYEMAVLIGGGVGIVGALLISISAGGC